MMREHMTMLFLTIRLNRHHRHPVLLQDQRQVKDLKNPGERGKSQKGTGTYTRLAR
jgi:hypothetical protein